MPRIDKRTRADRKRLVVRYLNAQDTVSQSEYARGYGISPTAFNRWVQAHLQEHQSNGKRQHNETVQTK